MEDDMAVTIADIEMALARRHPIDKGWVFATKVYTSTGATANNSGGLGGLRQIDAFAMAVWPSMNYQRIAYEIKVNRADFLRELRDPAKRAQAYYLSDKFYFAVSPGIATKEDFREDRGAFFDCGLLEIHEDGSIKAIMHPLLAQTVRGHWGWPMPIDFIASFLATVARAKDALEAKL